MLYIRNHKISELSVEFIATFQSKLLHLDVIYLPCVGRKRFREKLPWFGESKRTLSGYRVTEFNISLYIQENVNCVSGTADLSLVQVQAQL